VFITFILPFYLEARVFTAPQFLEKRFDHRAKLIFSGFLLLAGLLKLPNLFILILPGVMAQRLYSGLDNPDRVFPLLAFDLLPTGLRGLMLAALAPKLPLSIGRVAGAGPHHRGGLVVTHKIYRRIQKKVALIQIFMQKETSWKWGAQRQIWCPIF